MNSYCIFQTKRRSIIKMTHVKFKKISESHESNASSQPYLAKITQVNQLSNNYRRIYLQQIRIVQVRTGSQSWRRNSASYDQSVDNKDKRHWQKSECNRSPINRDWEVDNDIWWTTEKKKKTETSHQLTPFSPQNNTTGLIRGFKPNFIEGAAYPTSEQVHGGTLFRLAKYHFPLK